MSDKPAPPPVTIVRRRTVASNTKWHIYFDEISDESGNRVDDYLVIHPIAIHADRRISGVTVVPILEDRVVLTRNYRYPLDVSGWEVVRGFVDEGETPVEAAVREVAEETGLRTSPSSLVPLGFTMPEPSTIAGRSALFAALDCVPGEDRDRTEIGLGACRAHSREEIEAMLQRFEIEDAMTEIALRRYLRLPAAG